MKIRAQGNTDAIDIENNCLGISVWIEGDALNILNTNRGLHTQIRHNKDRETFKYANAVQRLFSAAPELLEALEACLNDDAGDLEPETVHKAMQAIKKARGEET